MKALAKSKGKTNAIALKREKEQNSFLSQYHAIVGIAITKKIK